MNVLENLKEFMIVVSLPEFILCLAGSLLLGYWLRARQLLAETTIDDLRWMIVNLALPSVLFVSFLNVEFERSYLILFCKIRYEKNLSFLRSCTISQRK